uniref:Uncharacterized protein n=1 Tax=Magallana gigas TaxID=29159 RepID=A0A8W8IGE9_MAGGI
MKRRSQLNASKYEDSDSDTNSEEIVVHEADSIAHSNDDTVALRIENSLANEEDNNEEDNNEEDNHEEDRNEEDTQISGKYQYIENPAYEQQTEPLPRRSQRTKKTTSWITSGDYIVNQQVLTKQPDWKIRADYLQTLVSSDVFHSENSKELIEKTLLQIISGRH